MTNAASMAPTQPDNRKLYRPRDYRKALAKTRFFRDRRKRLVAHIGGAPDARQAITIDRIVSVEWSINRLQQRLDDGEISQHAARELLAFHNHLRLLMASLGPAAKAKAQTLEEFAAQLVRERAAGAAT